jgi:AcrR family transcriptional regulator
MTEEKAQRGRPRLAPEDNETRERLLNTGQRLFAEKGFSKVTLRELTTAAGTNLGSVNYYFGSKDQLLLALIRRAARRVQEERLKLLAQARQSLGSVAEKVRAVLHALLAPAIASAAESEVDFLYSALIARTLADSPKEMTDTLVRQTSHLNPFVEALQGLLPAVPVSELYWRLHFVLNIEHALVTEAERLQHMSGGLCDTRDRAATLQRVLDFVVPGLLGLMPK